jgi:hypothetical protein
LAANLNDNSLSGKSVLFKSIQIKIAIIYAFTGRFPV